MQLYTRGIAARPTVELVALCDLNVERMNVHQQILTEQGRLPAKRYHPVGYVEAGQTRADADQPLLTIRMISTRC